MVKLSYTPIKYSCRDFILLIHKRVRKTLREELLFNPKKPLVVFKDGSKECIIGKKIMEELFPHLTIREIKRKQKNCIVFANMEREINSKFEAFIKDSPQPRSNYIRPLANVLEEEILVYAKCRKIRVLKSKEPINTIISEMQKKYSETKFSLGKSLAVLERKNI